MCIRDSLEQYEVLRPTPIRLLYRDHEVLLPPLCSAGGVLTGFTLRLLSAFDVAAHRHGSAGHLQLLVEVMAATTRARAQWDEWIETLPGDEATARLLDERLVARYRAEVRAALADRSPSPTAAEPPGPSNTSHLSVMDAAGLAVGLTTTCLLYTSRCV